MAKKFNVTRIGASTKRPIVSSPVPVKNTWSSDKTPLYVAPNETIIESVVDKDGTNYQTFYKSNMQPSFGFNITEAGDSTAVIFDPTNDLGYRRKYKPGTKQFQEAAAKAAQYNVPLATYKEAYDNYNEVQEQVDSMQEGGEIPSADQQQQLFVAIITDMAKTLGVEPSQELAEAVMTAFENNDDSQGLLTLFTKTKNKFMNETGLFREGGKMIAFVEKFKCGGKSPKKTSKKQDGGEVELTRRQARDLSKLNKGYDNGNFRLAYQNAKNALSENSDLKGREKRMAARRMVSGVNDVAPVAPAVIPAEQAQVNVAPALNPVQPLAPVRSVPAPLGPVDRVQVRVNDAIDGYQRGTDRIIDGIQSGANRAYDAVQDGIRRANDGIQTGGNAIVDGMQNVSRRAGDWVQNTGNRVFDGIQSASNIFGIRPEFVDRAIDGVQAGVNRAYDNAQDFGARVVDGIQTGANRAYDAVQDGARRLGDGVQNVGNRIVDGGQRVRNAVIDGTQSFGNRVVDGFQAGAQRLGQGIQRAGQRLSEWFR